MQLCPDHDEADLEELGKLSNSIDRILDPHAVLEAPDADPELMEELWLDIWELLVEPRTRLLAVVALRFGRNPVLERVVRNDQEFEVLAKLCRTTFGFDIVAEGEPADESQIIYSDDSDDPLAQ